MTLRKNNKGGFSVVFFFLKCHLHRSPNLHHLDIESQPPKMRWPLICGCIFAKGRDDLCSACFFSTVYRRSSAWLCTDLLTASWDLRKDTLNRNLGAEFRCVGARKKKKKKQVSVFHIGHGRCSRKAWRLSVVGTVSTAHHLETCLGLVQFCVATVCVALTAV